MKQGMMGQSSEGKHEEDASLSEFLASLIDYSPTIPDELVEHYLAKSGFQSPDLRLIRLVSIATQKFISEVATDALQHCKARQSSIIKDKRDKQQKDKRLILTMDDLSKALREAPVPGTDRTRQNTALKLKHMSRYMNRLDSFIETLYGVNLKHQEYFADSLSAGIDPASRDE